MSTPVQNEIIKTKEESQTQWGSVDLYSVLDIQSVADAVRRGRLRCFGHLEWKCEDWVSEYGGGGEDLGRICDRSFACCIEGSDS